MMTRFPRAAVCAAMLLAAGFQAPAGATVKDGVDAWQARDYPRAVSAWRGPAAAGDADAQFNLGQAYKLGRGVSADMKTARILFEKAAVQGHEQAQANLGLVLFQTGDRKGAMPWLQRAALRGEPRAQYVVGTAHFNGDLAAKDWPRAYAMMTRAAAAGLPQAGRSLAEMDKYIPIGQRQQGTQIAANLASAADESRAGEDRAEMVMASSSPSPAPARAAAPAPARTVPARAVPTSTVPTRTVPVPPSTRPAPAPVRAAAAATPAPVTASAGGWRVQLGAFATPAAAQAAWASFGGVAGMAGLRPQYTKAGALTRLQAGPLSDRAAAGRACAAAVRAGKGCFPVAP